MFTFTFRVPWLCVIVWCLAFQCLKSESALSIGDCLTPTKEQGSCVPVKECKPMMDYLRSITKTTSEMKEELKQYDCGFEGKEVKVCCPNDPITLQNVPSHKNIHLLPKKCGLSTQGSRLIGGSKAFLFEVPWIALLSYKTKTGTRFQCAGSVISDRYILTAAHCLSNTERFELTGVRCGEQNLDTEIDCEDFDDKICADAVQDIAIEKVIIHPEYNSIFHANDIGLIRLAAPLNTSVDSVQPICLPINSNSKNVTKWLTTAGWDLIGTRRSDLQKISKELVSQENCEIAYEKFSVHINKKQICASQKENQDSCDGDSGGPLYSDALIDNDIRTVQYGIVSFGPRHCNNIDVPYVYTRTESYIDWILDNLQP